MMITDTDFSRVYLRGSLKVHIKSRHRTSALCLMTPKLRSWHKAVEFGPIGQKWARGKEHGSRVLQPCARCARTYRVLGGSA